MAKIIQTLRPVPTGPAQHKLKKIAPPPVAKPSFGGGGGRFGLGGKASGNQEARAAANAILAQLLMSDQ